MMFDRATRPTYSEICIGKYNYAGQFSWIIPAKHFIFLLSLDLRDVTKLMELFLLTSMQLTSTAFFFFKKKGGKGGGKE